MANKTITKWGLDPMHSEVQFKVKHLVISTVTASFKSFDASAETIDEDFNGASINFSLDVDSIDTNQADRDGHLKSADFFETEKYPKISFMSTSFKKIGGDDYKLEGDLTIKDVTKPVILDVEFGGIATDFYGNVKAGFDLIGKISRKEFGLQWNAITEAGAIVVGDEVKLFINIQLSKQA